MPAVDANDVHGRTCLSACSLSIGFPVSWSSRLTVFPVCLFACLCVCSPACLCVCSSARLLVFRRPVFRTSHLLVVSSLRSFVVRRFLVSSSGLSPVTSDPIVYLSLHPAQRPSHAAIPSSPLLFRPSPFRPSAFRPFDRPIVQPVCSPPAGSSRCCPRAMVCFSMGLEIILTIGLCVDGSRNRSSC